MAGDFSGSARIFDTNGNLLTVGLVHAVEDQESGTWQGTLEVLPGTGVAGKALVVDLEMNGHRSRAQLIPIDDKGEPAHSRVMGLGPKPF